MHWLLLAVLVVLLLCSRLAPNSALARSAADAFDSNIRQFVSRGAVGADEGFNADWDEDMEDRRRFGETTATVPYHTWTRRATAQRNAWVPNQTLRDSVPPPDWKTSVVRKRPTPLMQKKVAVRYGFRCALCNKPLDETWETDHIIPLNQARSLEDAQILNGIDNLQPVHRACHQVKSSNEAARSVRRAAR